MPPRALSRRVWCKVESYVRDFSKCGSLAESGELTRDMFQAVGSRAVCGSLRATSVLLHDTALYSTVLYHALLLRSSPAAPVWGERETASTSAQQNDTQPLTIDVAHAMSQLPSIIFDTAPLKLIPIRHSRAQQTGSWTEEHVTAACLDFGRG